MTKKVQVVLDEETYHMLEDLARPRAGNKSFVVREALRHFADRENIEHVLDAVFAQRHAREAMEAGIAAHKAGNLVPHERVTGGIRARKTIR